MRAWAFAVALVLAIAGGATFVAAQSVFSSVAYTNAGGGWTPDCYSCTGPWQGATYSLQGYSTQYYYNEFADAQGYLNMGDDLPVPPGTPFTVLVFDYSNHKRVIFSGVTSQGPVYSSGTLVTIISTWITASATSVTTSLTSASTTQTNQTGSTPPNNFTFLSIILLLGAVIFGAVGFSGRGKK